MRIGVVSDTHDNARNVERIVEVLRGAEVERLVHTGDVTRGRTLETLTRLGVPIFGVYGNNDVLRDEFDEVAVRHEIFFAEPPVEFRWDGRNILVVHDPLDIEPALRDDHGLVLHGHNHRRVVDRTEDRLTFNPGECAGQMEGRNAVGVVDLATLEPEVLLF